MKRILHIWVFCFILQGMMAQDTARKQTIQITSSFKPTLKPAAKIYFNATPPPPAEIRRGMVYNVPPLQFVPSLQPISLKPLALQVDTALPRQWNNYVKVGAGNFRGLLAEAAMAVNKGKNTQFNVLAQHLSQKGNLPLQQYGNTNVAAYLNTRVQKLELYGKASFRNNLNYLYGPDPTFINLPKDSMRRNYRSLALHTGLRNALINKYGVSYNPELKLDLFSDHQNATEYNASLDVPIEKKFVRSFSFLMLAHADVTRFNPHQAPAYNNNVFFVNTALLIQTPNLKGRLGIRPTWDNGNFKMLSDVQLDYQLHGNEAILTLGWLGTVRKNNYLYLAGQNPFIAQPLAQFNTRIQQLFGGFKGTLAEQFTYRVTSGYTVFHGAPLFINNVRTALFDVSNEQRIRAIHTIGELSWMKQDKFQLRTSMELMRFVGVLTHQKAFHMLPMQLSAALRWQPDKDVTVKTDFFMWRGPFYFLTPNIVGRLNNAYDLNAGIEYRVAPAISLWLQCNNILNNRYQRWYNYEVLGFNLLGGIRLTFDQKQ